MTKLILASHGDFANGILSSVTMITGKKDSVIVIDAYLDQSNFSDKLDEILNQIDDNEEIVMLSDLYGGSVNQAMSLRLTRPNTFLVTGINLPLVLELSLSKKKLTHEELQSIVNKSRDALRIVDLDVVTHHTEDFFSEETE